MKAWATGDCDNGGDEWEQEILLAEQAVQAINKLNPKPKFFVLCGDLVHAMPGKTRAVAEILSPSLKKKRSLLKDISAQWRLIPFSSQWLQDRQTSENTHSF